MCSQFVRKQMFFTLKEIAVNVPFYKCSELTDKCSIEWSLLIFQFVIIAEKLQFDYLSYQPMLKYIYIFFLITFLLSLLQIAAINCCHKYLTCTRTLWTPCITTILVILFFIEIHLQMYHY